MGMSGIIYNDPAFVFNDTGNTISPYYLQNSNQTLFGTGTTQGVTQAYLTSNYYNQAYINSLSFSGGTGGSGVTISLTTTGTSGPATLGGNILNIPIYSGTTNTVATNSEIINASHMAFWGDSLTFGQGSFDATYPNAFAFASNYTIYNGGIGGQTASQVAARMTGDTHKFGWSQIIWVGRNDISLAIASATTISAIASMIAVIPHTRYIIVGITKQSTDTIGTSGATAINNLNSFLLTTYGNHFFDVNAYLLTQGNGSGQDNTDIANGVIPTSLKSDTTHLNTLGYSKVANQLLTFSSIYSLTSTDIITAGNGAAVSTIGLDQYSVNTGGQYQVGGQQVLYLPSQTLFSKDLFIGDGGGLIITGGTGNVSVSIGALKALTTGSNNTVLGSNALAAVTTSSSNTAIGFGALASTTATGNSSLGYLAGSSVTSAGITLNIGWNRTGLNTTGAVDIAGLLVGANATATGTNYAGNLGIAVQPTARLTLPSGTTGATSAPLKFTIGTNLATPEAGAVEYDGNFLYYTTSGSTRQTLATLNNFSTPTGFVSLSGTSGVSINFMRSDATPALDQTIIPTWSGLHTFQQALTGTGTTTNGLIVGAGTLATSAITVQNSPNLRIRSNAWGTVAASATTVDFYMYVAPATGTVPNGNLFLYSQISGNTPQIIQSWANVGGTQYFNTVTQFINFFGNTSTDGFVLNNTAASSLANPVQKSSRIRYQGSVWNTTPTAAANYFGFTNEAAGISGATPVGTLDWYSYLGVSTTPTFTKRMTLDTSGNLSLVNGGLNLSNTGKISIGTGTTAATAGVATLVTGTVTINTTSVTANSLIYLTYNTPGGTLAALSQGTITPGTSFVINSLTTAGLVNTSDTSRVNWFFVN